MNRIFSIIVKTGECVRQCAAVNDKIERGFHAGGDRRARSVLTGFYLRRRGGYF